MRVLDEETVDSGLRFGVSSRSSRLNRENRPLIAIDEGGSTVHTGSALEIGEGEGGEEVKWKKEDSGCGEEGMTDRVVGCR